MLLTHTTIEELLSCDIIPTSCTHHNNDVPYVKCQDMQQFLCYDDLQTWRELHINVLFIKYLISVTGIKNIPCVLWRIACIIPAYWLVFMTREIMSSTTGAVQMSDTCCIAVTLPTWKHKSGTIWRLARDSSDYMIDRCLVWGYLNARMMWHARTVTKLELPLSGSFWKRGRAVSMHEPLKSA